MLLRKLFEEARIEVHIPGTSPPLIYTGQGGPINAWSSGGRSLIFEDNSHIYRVKGVDPCSALTVEVGNSKKNRIEDVTKATAYVGANKYPPTGEPFGTLLPQKAFNEQRTIELLTTDYAKYDVSYPCKFFQTAPVKNGQVQNWFQLRNLEDDLRLEEFDQIMIDKMKDFSKGELEACYKDVLKLYGRLNMWAGVAMRTLLDCKLKPTARSFLPQNYTISKVGNGYGLFRVDHTSTQHLPGQTDQQIFDSLQKESSMGGCGLEQNVVLRFPTAILIAAEPSIVRNPKSLKQEADIRGGSMLAGAYYYMGSIYASTGYGHFVNVLVNAFKIGMSDPQIAAKEPIDEIWFQKVLK